MGTGWQYDDDDDDDYDDDYDDWFLVVRFPRNQLEKSTDKDTS